MKVVCILLKVKPVSVINPQTMENEFDYWQPSVTLMKGDLLENLINYDKDAITHELINKIRRDINHAEFTLEHIEKVS